MRPPHHTMENPMMTPAQRNDSSSLTPGPKARGWRTAVDAHPIAAARKSGKATQHEPQVRAVAVAPLFTVPATRFLYVKAYSTPDQLCPVVGGRAHLPLLDPELVHGGEGLRVLGLELVPGL
jgi:hypothetical protein